MKRELRIIEVLSDHQISKTRLRNNTKKLQTTGISRRKFVSSAAVAALSFHYIPSRLLGADAPSNKLNIAGIGVGGMGAANLRACESENIAALCDVDSKFTQ